VLTSLPLQMLVFFGGWWDGFFWLVTLAVFIFKGVSLPYGSRSFAAEFTFHFLWLLVEPARLFLVSKGNKMEAAGPLLYGTGLALPLAAYYAYYIAFQTYVLKIDVLLHAISLAFMGAQALLSLAASLRFLNAAKFA